MKKKKHALRDKRGRFVKGRETREKTEKGGRFLGRSEVADAEAEIQSATLRLVSGYCRGCTQFSHAASSPRKQCRVFLEPYPLWGKDEDCWARRGDGSTPSSRDIRAVLREEQRRGSGAGAEGQDRTHKLFGKERMKDNRWKEVWSGFLDDGAERARARRKLERQERKHNVDTPTGRAD